MVESRDRRRSFLQRLTGPNMNRDETPENKKRCCGFVNVEPVMWLLSISTGLLLTSQPLFTYWARCVEIAGQLQENANENITAICAQLTTNNGTLQDLVERDISSMKIWLQVCSGIPTLLIAPMIGTWSDKYGRKMPLLFSMSGFVVYNICQLMASLTYESWNIYIWYFIGEFCTGLTGGLSSIFATSLAIVTDDCRHKLKPGSSTVPLRIGVASFLQSFGSLMGTLVVSLIAVPALISVEKHSASYVQASVLQLAAVSLAFIYTLLFVRETHFPQKEGFGYNQLDENSQEINIIETPQKPGYVMSLVEVITEKRPGWTRMCLILSLFFVFVEFLSLDMSILFLLLKRPPFSWNDATFSYYSLIRGSLFSLGMVLCPLALTLVHWLGKDSIMIIFAISASATSFFLVSLANTTQEIFITAGLALITGGIAPGYRSFLPRMVPKEQTARLLTVCSILLAICPIISSLIFNSLFNLTMDWWPGFVFFVGAIIQVVVVFGQCTIHYLMRPQWKQAKILKNQERNTLSYNNENYADPEVEDNSGSNSAAGSTDLQVDSVDDRRPLAT